jgi:hypothetical protein
MNDQEIFDVLGKTSEEMKARAIASYNIDHFKTSKHMGMHGELLAAAYLIECGFFVYIPFKDRGPDLIAVDAQGEAYRIEVRTARENASKVLTFHREWADKADIYIGVVGGVYCIPFDKNGVRIGIGGDNSRTVSFIQD